MATEAEEIAASSDGELSKLKAEQGIKPARLAKINEELRRRKEQFKEEKREEEERIRLRGFAGIPYFLWP